MHRSAIFVAAMLITFSTIGAQTTITGTLLGHDGKPIPKTRIVLTIPSQDTSVKRIYADQDGKYSITIDSVGMFFQGKILLDRLLGDMVRALRR